MLPVGPCLGIWPDETKKLGHSKADKVQRTTSEPSLRRRGRQLPFVSLVHPNWDCLLQGDGGGLWTFTAASIREPFTRDTGENEKAKHVFCHCTMAPSPTGSKNVAWKTRKNKRAKLHAVAIGTSYVAFCATPEDHVHNNMTEQVRSFHN